MAAISNAVNASPLLHFNDSTPNSLDKRRAPIRDASNDVYCARCDLTTIPHDVVVATYEDARALATALGVQRIPTAESLRKAKLRDVDGFFPVAHDVNANAETNDPCKWLAYWTWKLGGPDPRPRYRVIELTGKAKALRCAVISDEDLLSLEREVAKLQTRVDGQRMLTNDRDRLAHEVTQIWSSAEEIGKRIKCESGSTRDYQVVRDLLVASKNTTRYLVGMEAALNTEPTKATLSPKQRTKKLATELLDTISNYRIDRTTIIRILAAHGAFEAVV
jgi:hypothetical protein